MAEKRYIFNEDGELELADTYSDEDIREALKELPGWKSKYEEVKEELVKVVAYSNKLRDRLYRI